MHAISNTYKQPRIYASEISKSNKSRSHDNYSQQAREALLKVKGVFHNLKPNKQKHLLSFAERVEKLDLASCELTEHDEKVLKGHFPNCKEIVTYQSFLKNLSPESIELLKKGTEAQILKKLKNDPEGIKLACLFRKIVSTIDWHASERLKNLADQIHRIFSKEEKGTFSPQAFEIFRKVEPFYERGERFVEHSVKSSLLSLPDDVLGHIGKFMVKAGDIVLFKDQNLAMFETCKAMQKVKPLVLRGNENAIFDIFERNEFDTGEMSEETLELLKSIGSQQTSLPFAIYGDENFKTCMELFPKLKSVRLRPHPWNLSRFTLFSKKNLEENRYTLGSEATRSEIASQLGSKSLQKFEIECASFSDSLLQQALQKSRHLQELSLYDSLQITDETLKNLKENHPQLKTLNVADIDNITDNGFKELAFLSELRTLSIYHSLKSKENETNEISGETLAQIAEGCKHIQTLELSLPHMDMSEIVPHLLKFEKLTSLHLSSGDDPITDEHLETISRLHALTSLDLDNCDISAEGLMHLQILTQLKSFSIHISDANWRARDQLSELLPHFSELTKLDLYLELLPLEENVQHAIQALPQLSELGVSSERDMCEDELQFLAQLRNLKVLSFPLIISISSLRKILQNMPFLKEIHLKVVTVSEIEFPVESNLKQLFKLQQQFPHIRLIKEGEPIATKLVIQHNKRLSRQAGALFDVKRAILHSVINIDVPELWPSAGAVLSDILLHKAGLRGSFLKNGTRKVVVWGAAFAASGFSPVFIARNTVASLALLFFAVYFDIRRADWCK